MNLSKLLDKTFWKFILVGVANTLFGTAIMFGFYNLLHFGYWVSSAANYILASILSYFLNKYFTFKNKKKSFKQIIVFAINIATCYFIAYGLAKPLATWILSGAQKNVQENIAMLVGMGLFVVLNYLGQRFFVFRIEQKDSLNEEKIEESKNEDEPLKNTIEGNE
jgi:putative flippase GtrA